MPLIGDVSVVGVGETEYYKRGTAPYGQLGLCAEAILAACRDAGVDPHEVDGVASYGHDANEGPKIAAALGFNELRWASMVFGGGGGSCAGALVQAAAALRAGHADKVVVIRASAERSVGRLGAAVSAGHMNAHYRAHGVISPAQVCALRTQRLFEHDGVPPSTMKALALAAYHHAAANPRAVGRNARLDDEAYDHSRWIAEPYRLFDCSRENDGAGALLVMRSDDPGARRERAVRVISGGMSSPAEWGEILDNEADFTSGGYRLLAERMWSETGLSPADIDNVQLYENFTGAAVAALIDHGFCTKENAGEVLTFANLIAPNGGLPVNTAGGNLGEGFVHGIGLMIEAARQIRGESPNQVPGSRRSLVISGPIDAMASSVLFGATEE
jgi:acetyl-CoA acetyltransferase